jgi:hypothetical protein
MPIIPATWKADTAAVQFKAIVCKKERRKTSWVC